MRIRRTKHDCAMIATLLFAVQLVHVLASFGRDDMVRKVAVIADVPPEEALAVTQESTASGSDMVRKVFINAAGLSEEVWKHMQDGPIGGNDMVRKGSVTAAGVSEEVLKHGQYGPTTGDDIVRKGSINAGGLSEDVLKHVQNKGMRAISVDSAGETAVEFGSGVARRVGVTRRNLAGNVAEQDVVMRESQIGTDQVPVVRKMNLSNDAAGINGTSLDQVSVVRKLNLSNDATGSSISSIIVELAMSSAKGSALGSIFAGLQEHMEKMNVVDHVQSVGLTLFVFCLLVVFFAALLITKREEVEQSQLAVWLRGLAGRRDEDLDRTEPVSRESVTRPSVNVISLGPPAVPAYDSDSQSSHCSDGHSAFSDVS